MMVPNDLGDLGVVVHIRKNSLTDYRVLLHLPPFIECERTGLLEKTRREANLPDVVDQAAQVSKLNLRSGETHPRRDVACVNSDRCRVASRIPISSVESGDKGGRKREVRSLKVSVHLGQITGKFALCLIEHEGSLGCQRWSEKERKHHRRERLIAQDEKRNGGNIERQLP